MTLQRYGSAVVRAYEDSAEALADLNSHALASNTLRAYESDWRTFAAWAEGKGIPVRVGDEIPPALVLSYLAESQGKRAASTMARHLSAIKHWHTVAGLVSPTEHPQVKQALAGYTRKHGRAPDRAAPLFLAELAAGLPRGEDERSVRDRAILTVGWHGALRRSELVSLRVADIENHPQGIVLTVRRSKTDQESRGQKIALHYYHDEELCPVRNLRAWLRCAGISEGRVFPVTGKTVTRLVAATAARAGLEGNYSAHSLRAGFVSECSRRGIPNIAIRAVTRHSSDGMLSVYSRPGDLFRDSAGAWLSEVA